MTTMIEDTDLMEGLEPLRIASQVWPGMFYAATKTLRDGRFACVHFMSYGKGRLCVGEAERCMGYDAGYCYETIGRAVEALKAWDGDGEPTGWIREVVSDRRRGPAVIREYD